jgi:hypothetical protein
MYLCYGELSPKDPLSPNSIPLDPFVFVDIVACDTDVIEFLGRRPARNQGRVGAEHTMPVSAARCD